MNTLSTDFGSAFETIDCGAFVPDELCLRKQTKTSDELWLAILASILIHLSLIAVIFFAYQDKHDDGFGYTIEAVDIVIADDETAITQYVETHSEKIDPVDDQKELIKQTEPLSSQIDEDAIIKKANHSTTEPASSLELDKALTPNPPSISINKTETQATLSQSYSAEIAKHIAKHKRFPILQKHSPIEGTVYLSFELNEHGQIISVTILQSSGVAIFDEEAKAMIHRAQPFPVDVSQVGKKLAFTIPVTYKQGQ